MAVCHSLFFSALHSGFNWQMSENIFGDVYDFSLGNFDSSRL